MSRVGETKNNNLLVVYQLLFIYQLYISLMPYSAYQNIEANADFGLSILQFFCAVLVFRSCDVQQFYSEFQFVTTSTSKVR
jgi:hypothetical protein